MKSKNFLDKTNRYIISELQKDGRTKFTTLARKLKVTPAAVKERIDRLVEKDIIKISALVNLSKLYPISAAIGIEADAECTKMLVRRLRNCPLVFHLNKTSGMHNLVLSLVATDMAQIEEFLNKQIRSEPGIKHIEVNISNDMIIPEYVPLRLYYARNPDYSPCGLPYDDDTRCPSCPAFTKKEK